MLTALTSSEMQSIALGYAMMLVVPGPSLLIVIQAGLATHRHHGVITALGVAMGASLLVMCLTFSKIMFPLPDAVIVAGKVACVLVLLTAGIRALRSGMRRQEVEVVRRPSTIAPFAIGLITAVSNPLSLVFFSSAAMTLPSTNTISSIALLPLVIFLMAFAWYGCVGLAMAQPRISIAHRTIFRLLSIGSGIALVLFASTMALSSWTLLLQPASGSL